MEFSAYAINAKIPCTGPYVTSYLTLCLLGNFACLLSSANLIFRNQLSQNYFRNTIRVSNSLDPDQARHYVGPDQGSNCFQNVSVDVTRSQRYNRLHLIIAYISTRVRRPVFLNRFCFNYQSFIRGFCHSHQIKNIEYKVSSLIMTLLLYLSDTCMFSETFTQ